MTAFSDAFYILKNEHFFDIAYNDLVEKGKAEEFIQLQQRRQFVLDNENSPDPAMRQAAEDEYQKLMREMSARRGQESMNAPSGPVGEGAAMGQMSQPPMSQASPLEKAWGFLKKNVVGHQDGQEYNMPDPISSMAQRQQIPEMMTQTTQTPAPGMFGRFKQPVTNTAEIPTGQMSLGQRPPSALDEQGQPIYPVQNRQGEGAVQPNQPHPMGGPNSIGQAPGAQVTRAPRPGPFAPNDYDDPMGHKGPAFQQSLSGQGYYTNEQGEAVTDNVYDRKNMSRMGNDDFDLPVGQAPRWMSNKNTPDGSYGDQFAPSREY